MKLHYIYNTVALALLATTFVACNGLDELPDNRTLMDSSDKVKSLMTSAYPLASPAVMCEWSGDNLLDDNVVVKNTHNSAYNNWLDEAYQWKDIENYSPNSDDTPYSVWEQYYAGVSVCNHAIEAMEGMSNDPANDTELAGTWAEAHLLRAYIHFMLVNVFAESYQDEAANTENVGIPYVTKTEDVVKVNYSTSEYLHNIKETYELIEKDMNVAVGIDPTNNQIYNRIDDNNYTTNTKAFHFNRTAALAFASRYYLFVRDYNKCKLFADAVLGDDPSSMLRKWSTMNMNTAYTKRDSYWDETANSNIMIQSTYSLQWRYTVGVARHAINTGATVQAEDGNYYTIPSTLDITMWGSGPCWSQYLPCYSGLIYVNSSGQEFGCYHMHLIEYFEYTDKIAGIGYVHMLYNPFTSEETLLCRAEAELYLGQQGAALNDLKAWAASKASATKSCTDLDQAKITSFYTKTVQDQYAGEMHAQEMGFEKVLTDSYDKALLACILHFRRIETVHNGDRWFDIKRYGITVRHFWRGPREDVIHVDSLTYNDKRRVLQLPKTVIDAGYPASRGESSSSSSGGHAEGFCITTPYSGAEPQVIK